MQTEIRQALAVVMLLMGGLASFADARPPILQLTGNWQVRVTAPAQAAGEELTATLNVSPPTVTTVRAEKYAVLPLFNPKAQFGWWKGVPLIGLRAVECSTRDLLDPASLQVHAGPEPDSQQFVLGKDYAADIQWGSVGRLAGGRIHDRQPVYVTYTYAAPRIDAIILTRQQQVELRQGKPHVAVPLPATIAEGERRLANIWLPGRMQNWSLGTCFRSSKRRIRNRRHRRLRLPSGFCQEPSRSFRNVNRCEFWRGATALRTAAIFQLPSVGRVSSCPGCASDIPRRRSS